MLNRPKVEKRKTRSIQSHRPAVEDPLPFEKQFEDNLNVAELDLVEDLNEQFFGISYELVQQLVPVNSFIASKLKQFVDLLARMHSYYSEAVAASTAMQSKLNEAEEKLQLTLESTSISTEMVKKMRESLAEAWRTADAAHDRETMLYSNMDSPYSAHPKPTTDVDVPNNHADIRFRGLVFRERDRLSRELKEHQKRLEINRFYSESMEEIIKDNRKTISRQQVRVKFVETEMFKLDHKVRVCVETYQDQINHHRREIDTLTLANLSLRQLEKKYVDCTALNANYKEVIEKLTRDNFNLQKTYHRTTEDFNLLKKTVDNLESDNKVLRHEKYDLNIRIRTNLREFKKKEEIYLGLRRRFHQLAKKNNDLVERETFQKNLLTAADKKITIFSAQLDDARIQKEESDRNRHKLRGEIATLNDLVSNLRYDLASQRNRTQDTQYRLDSANILLSEKEKAIVKITKERNDLNAEINDQSKTIEVLEDNVAEKMEKLTQLHEHLQQKQHDFNEFKQQMESLRSEKAILQRSYSMCEQDRQALQNMNTKNAFQIVQLSNQVSLHEKEAVTMKNQIDQLHNLVKHKETEVHGKDRLLKSVRMTLHETKIRSGQLQHTIEEDEKRFKQITHSLEEERKTKNFVGQQMMRRNGELRMLQEKLSMMQLALTRGTMQYNQRIEDIRLLKIEIRNLRMSNECLERSVISTANMRREVVRLERQLLRERMHVAAFTEEIKHPYRIHRWRLLRGQDPHIFEMIRKIQVLLKRNIRLTVERRNLETKLQDLQLLYDTLKKQLKYVPDPQTRDRLWLQLQLNQRQSRKVRAMKAELAINEIDLQTRDVIIDEYQHALKNQQLPNPAIVQALVEKSPSISELYHNHVFQTPSFA